MNIFKKYATNNTATSKKRGTALCSRPITYRGCPSADCVVYFLLLVGLSTDKEGRPCRALLDRSVLPVSESDQWKARIVKYRACKVGIVQDLAIICLEQGHSYTILFSFSSASWQDINEYAMEGSAARCDRQAFFRLLILLCITLI